MSRSKVFWPLVVGILVGAAAVLAAVTIQIRTYPTSTRTSSLRADEQARRDAFATELLEAWDAHDVDRILTFYTDDAFYEDVAVVENGWAEPMRGQQMIRESLVEMFADMPDLGFEFVSASGAGDRMVIEWIMTGTRYRDYSGRFSIRAVSVITLEEGKITRASDYYDAYLLLSQLGMVPTLSATDTQ